MHFAAYSACLGGCSPPAAVPARLQVEHLLSKPTAGPLAALQATVTDAGHAVLQPGLIAQIVQHSHLETATTQRAHSMSSMFDNTASPSQHASGQELGAGSIRQ